MANAGGRPNPGVLKPGENIPEVAERWGKALELRKAGASFQVIADRLGYASASGAYDAVMGALKATLQEPAADVRALEVERLDRIMLGLWQRATQGDAEAVDRVLRIMARRAALLGLDAPARTDVTSNGQTMPRIERVEIHGMPARVVPDESGAELAN